MGIPGREEGALSREAVLALLGSALRQVFVAALAVLLMATVLWAAAWLFFGWRTLYGYGSILVWCGIGTVLIGAFSLTSARTVALSRDYQSPRDGMETHRAHHADRDYVDSRVFSFVRMLLVGGGAIALGEWLRSLGVG